ncbi:MAG: peptide/nickel transport system substrate-binding protein [Solirubrobacteraceae bacterium]|jgi:peptide/nickel transport system substrate-binding protein|nr:peptide/nickel transport system substrate-binding protein [Solirubrobacteraceae bacterium]
MPDTPDRTGRSSRYTRRTLLSQGGRAAGAAALGPTLLAACGGGSRRRNTARALTIAAPATPTGFDREFNYTTGDVEQASAVMRSAVDWKTEPAPGMPAAWRVFRQSPVPQAGAVERWELSEGGRKATFHLRQGMISNYGNELTAADALWTYQRVYEIKGGNSFLFFEGGYGDPKKSEIEQIDKYSYSIRGEAPTPMLVKTQGSCWQWFIDSTEAKKHAPKDDPWAQDWLKANPAGWGPYRMESFRPNEEIVWRARTDQGEAAIKPNIDKVIYRQVPDPSTRTALIQRGEVDVAEWLRPDDLKALARARGVRVLYFPYNFQTYLIPNNKSFPAFKNVLVRQALAYATPQNEIGQKIYNGQGRPMHSVVPPTYPDYTDRYFHYGYDPAKARELLKKAGYGDGLKFTMSFTNAVPETPDLAQVLQTAYREVGVEVTLNQQPAAVFFDAIYGPNKNYEAALHREGAVVPDPLHSTFQFFHSTSAINTAQVNDPELDAALEQATRADAETRGPLFAKVQKMVLDKAVWVPIWVSGTQVAIRDNLQNYTWVFSNGFYWPAAQFS